MLTVLSLSTNVFFIFYFFSISNSYSAKPWDTSPSQVDLFDARRRTWYIQGATSPKNVIILIDASGSMHGVPMRIAKLSAQNLIDTLGDNDFFNVVYVSILSVIFLCSDFVVHIVGMIWRWKGQIEISVETIEW